MPVQALVVWSMVAAATAHPIHSTLTELRYDATSRVVELSVRMFADDLAAARPATQSPLRYLAESIALATHDGHPLPVETCGERRAGDLIWLCLHLRLPAGTTPSGLRLRNRLLFERFGDQVNIVQTAYGGRTETMVFTRGDADKTLR